MRVVEIDQECCWAGFDSVHEFSLAIYPGFMKYVFKVGARGVDGYVETLRGRIEGRAADQQLGQFRFGFG